jgi:hypothetical protein
VSLILQELVVAVLVVAAALFAAWRLVTVRLRLKALTALGTLPLIATAGWFVALRARTVGKLTSACGGCSGATPRAVSRNQTPGALRR